MLFCLLLIFFKINFFEKFFQQYHQCQTDWIPIRPDILSGLIWGQTVCKGYQQTTLVGKELRMLLGGKEVKKIHCICDKLMIFYFSALVNTRNEYLLNGEFIISMYPQTINVLGGTLQYSGSETIHERINSTGMLRENIIVQVSADHNLQ